ncbi:hypothetical protein [Serratia quinivorans]|uniref:hypothetical protein n=1 Tax=Serratia quinivorans TaxID=137545 RepID=UPI0021BD5526|nr:hypothetical protein [Serratia quinivorans]
MKERKIKTLREFIGLMTNNELQELIVFNTPNAPFNKVALDVAITELRKRNEKSTA